MRQRRLSNDSNYSKVCQNRLIRTPEQDVGGLDIPVNQIPFFHMCNRVCKAVSQMPQLWEGHQASRHLVEKRSFSQELLRDDAKIGVIGLFHQDELQLRDGGMTAGLESRNFALESAAECRGDLSNLERQQFAIQRDQERVFVGARAEIILKRRTDPIASLFCDPSSSLALADCEIHRQRTSSPEREAMGSRPHCVAPQSEH